MDIPSLVITVFWGGVIVASVVWALIHIKDIMGACGFSSSINRPQRDDGTTPTLTPVFETPPNRGSTLKELFSRYDVETNPVTKASLREIIYHRIEDIEENEK